MVLDNERLDILDETARDMERSVVAQALMDIGAHYMSGRYVLARMVVESLLEVLDTRAEYEKANEECDYVDR